MVIDLDIYKEIRDGKRLDWKWQEYFYNADRNYWKRRSTTGNGKSIFTTLGASNHTEKEREINDYYATDPIAVDALLQGGGRTES